MIEYRENDTLECTETGRRLIVLKATEQKLLVQPTVDGQQSRWVGLRTIVDQYANLTAMTDGRYLALRR